MAALVDLTSISISAGSHVARTACRGAVATHQDLLAAVVHDPDVRQPGRVQARRSVPRQCASQPKPLSRPEALRQLAGRGLPSTTDVTVSDEQHSWGGDAVMTAPKPRKLK
jgi:hypothetical protein